VLQIYPYQCECGWNKEYITGGFRRVITLTKYVENQLDRAQDSKAKAIWREMYRGVIRDEIVPVNIKIREGFVSCYHCKSSHNQIALYDSSKQPIHPILCNQCGKEGHFSSPSEPTVCPMCNSTVTTGEIFSTEEQISRLLQKCHLTLSEDTSEQLLIVIGDRSTKYLSPFLNNIPFLSIEDGKQNDVGLDLTNLLTNTKKVFLHTYFETPLVTKLTHLLAKHLFSMNIELIPIVGTSPGFAGKRSTDRVMGYIQELQSYCPQTVLISSSIRKEFDSVMDIFEQHIPREILQVIDRFSLEKETPSPSLQQHNMFL
jgi:uncharacterized CHY-type Zn-finger protein